MCSCLSVFVVVLLAFGIDQLLHCRLATRLSQRVVVACRGATSHAACLVVAPLAMVLMKQSLEDVQVGELLHWNSTRRIAVFGLGFSGILGNVLRSGGGVCPAAWSRRDCLLRCFIIDQDCGTRPTRTWQQSTSASLLSLGP